MEPWGLKTLLAPQGTLCREGTPGWRALLLGWMELGQVEVRTLGPRWPLGQLPRGVVSSVGSVRRTLRAEQRHQLLREEEWKGLAA